jgi:23S rRNA (uracil1939-C5)-methyltransferase
VDELNRDLADLRRQRVRDGHYTLRAESGPRVFSQTNDEVAKALSSLIATIVPANQALLVDAYCGAGFFAKSLLDKFERVIGIDWDRFAIEAAQKNATPKEIYIAGDIEEQLLRALERGEAKKTTLIVDPPAAGLTATIRRVIVDLAPSTFLYISCNPPTLARDLKEFHEKFKIESVTPLDMFPQTAEIEVAVHLRNGSISNFGPSA